MVSASADGRVARGERSRRAIAEALVSLLEDGEAQPTARQVAQRAGVSLRLVFHHFEDMEAVLRAAVAVQVERHWALRTPVDPGMTLDDRITALARQRASLYQDIAPVRRAAAGVECGSPTLRRELGNARVALRGELAAVFAGEMPASPAEAEALLDSLELATSFETWDQLRRRMELDQDAATRTMARLLATSIDHRTGLPRAH